ncbi:MAG: CRTAC1 family protein [Phycisphaerales bacterium]
MLDQATSTHSSARSRAAALRLSLAFLLAAPMPTLAGVPDPFTEESAARGLIYQIVNYPPSFGHQGFGTAIADLNNDGHSDIISLGHPNRFVGVFENNGLGQFTDRTAVANLGNFVNPSDLVVFDYNNDGRLDILVVQLISPNRLFRNDGNFSFTLVDSVSLEDGGDSQGGTAADFDGDGWLDVYIANYSGIKGGAATSQIRNKLYKNLGAGQWQDVSVQQGVDDPGYGFFGQWFDANRDSWPELYLSNDRGHLPPFFAENRLWSNQKGQMVDISAGSGADIAIFSMGVAMGDLDQNGWPDLYCTNISGYPQGYNFLLMNQGPGENGQVTFVESSQQWGVRVQKTGWGAAFVDLTNNGRPDIYVNNSFSTNSLFLNNGTLPLVDTAAAMGVAGSNGLPRVSYSMAYGDLNGDGAIDMVVPDLGGNIRLYINNEAHKRNFVRLQVIDHPVQRPAANASVDGTFTHPSAGAMTNHQHQQFGGNNYLGQNELWCHFGIDEAPSMDTATITWQGGAQRTLTNIHAGTRAQVYHPDRLGDKNNDGAVTPVDLQSFAAAYAAIAVQPGLEMMDFSGDFIVDDDDMAAFLDRYAGPFSDCNNDGVSDPVEIITLGLEDLDLDGVPDQCPPSPCDCDLDRDGMVNSDDLNILLSAFGATDAGDVNRSGDTDFADLALMLSAFSIECIPG